MRPKGFLLGVFLICLLIEATENVLFPEKQLSWLMVVLSLLAGVSIALLLIAADQYLLKRNGGRAQYRYHLRWYGAAVIVLWLLTLFGWGSQAYWAMAGFSALLAAGLALWERQNHRVFTWKDLR